MRRVAPVSSKPQRARNAPKRVSVRVELLDGPYDLFLLALNQFREDRQRQHLSARLLCNREISFLVAEPLEAWLEVQGKRIVDRRANTSIGQEYSQFISPRHPHDILIISMSASGNCFRKSHRLFETSIDEEATVALRIRAPPLDPGAYMRELDPENGGLKGIDAEIAAHNWVSIGTRLPVHPQLAKTTVEFGVVSCHQPTIAETLRLFFGLARGTVLGARYTTGLIIPGRGEATLPLSERFFNGGENRVRSFKESELGPKDPSGDPVGGYGFNVFNLELRQRLIGNLIGTVFIDYGNVAPNRSRSERGLQPYDSRSDVISDTLDDFFKDFRPGVGFGLQYLLPVGPARVDFAFNPDRRSQDDEDSFVIHFSIGTAF